MVAKKFILKIMEEILGEYIINISKENLKVAVLRGKLKLDNVQLDGDLIGSHVLGAVGLSGFAVISCTAAHLRAAIPWSKLEKEPTKFELVGLQLICIPLLPSNAMRRSSYYGSSISSSNNNSRGNSGMEKDCTLRTRAKRSIIARFERNFFSWRIPGEGPPRPNPNEDRNTNHGDKKRRSSRGRNTNNGTGGDNGSVYSRRSSTMQQQHQQMNINSADDDKSFYTNYSNAPPDEGDIKDDVSEITSYTLNEASADKVKEMDNENQHSAWRQKLVQRILRNIEIGIRDLHIRCEVGQGSLKDTFQRHNKQKSLFTEKEDESAFAFGFNIDSLVLRSANSDWETGCNVDFEKKNNREKDTISVSGRETAIQETKYKIFFVKNVSMYWDDSPPVLLTECPLIKNNNEDGNRSSGGTGGGGISSADSHKIWTVVRIAMENMKNFQNPGEDVVNILMDKKQKMKGRGRSTGRSRSPSTIDIRRKQPFIDHHFVISPTTMEIRMMLHNLEVPKSHCQAEIMPCELTLNFSPKQMHQYRLLQYVMAAQQRLDTMIQQRPTMSPKEDPRAWWRYAISCVTTRPRVRPWRDVIKIVKKRSRYVGLVEKKHLCSDLGNLTPAENAELLSLEDMLPIETLLSFHLLALRNVQEIRNYEKGKKSRRGERSNTSVSDGTPNHPRSPHRRKRRSSSSKKGRYGDENDAYSMSDFGSPPRSSQRSSDINSSSGPIGISFVAADSATKHRDDNTDTGARTPTKSPLPRDPARGKRNQRKNGTLSPSSIQNRGSNVNKRHEDELSFADSFASVELDNLVNGIDSASKKLEFSLDDMSFPGMDKDEEVEDLRMVKTIRCHDLSIVVKIMDKKSVKTILKGNLKASTWIQHIPGNGVNLLFDLKNLRFIDCTSHHSSKLLSFEIPEVDPKSSTGFGSGIMVPIGISSSSDDDVFLESFCNEMRDGELALPPIGVVSRLLVSERPNGRSFSLSAHAATMVWNRNCYYSFMSTFFPSEALESRTILQNQLRNAATPVVHKAQVALTSPKALSINVNIEAPKVWFPVSQNRKDGALYVDVGKLTLELKKPEFLANMRWSMDCKGILAKFRRNASSVFFHTHTRETDLSEDGKSDIPIILPLNLHYVVERSGDGPAKIMQKDGVKYKQAKVATLKLSKICVKLVDVEVLAKAIGKWYATQLQQVKRKRNTKEGKSSQKSEDIVKTSSQHVKDQSVTLVSQDLNVIIEKIELYLQGKSSSKKLKSTKQKKRTYLVDLANITVSRCQRGCIQTTNGKLDYINIAQMMKDKRTSERSFKPSVEPRHTILRCTAKHLLSPTKTKGNNKDHGAISAKFIHNEATSVDDLDITFMHIENRITAIALKDCYAAINRILESIKIMTGEMERRVHEVGRLVRRESQNTQITSSDTMNGSEFSLYSENEVKETSLVLKVSLEKVAILVAGDMKEKNQSNTSTGHVIQMVSSALIMFQSVEDRDESGSKTFHVSLKDYVVSMNPQLKPTSSSHSVPLIGPTQMEFRSVNTTENSGVVVSREVSVSCDALNASVLAHDAMLISTVIKQYLDELKKNNSRTSDMDKKTNSPIFSQGKGSSIATTLKFQVLPFSMILMRRNNVDASNETCPLLEFRGEAHGKLQGYAHALFGESRADITLCYFNKEAADWEDFVESMTITIDFEQQPNDFILTTSIADVINANITSNLLVSLSEYQKEIVDADRNDDKSLQKKRSERTDSNHVTINNESGVDFFICYMEDIQNIEVDESLLEDNGIFYRVNHGQSRSIPIDPTGMMEIDQRMALFFTPKSERLIGRREPIFDIPFQCNNNEEKITKLPLSSKDSVNNVRYMFEPVVEWCMENQRLRSVYYSASAIDKGMDLLSNQIWSPSDRDLVQNKEEHWVHPYLDSDVCEWTDMTGVLRMERNRVMLPDNKWIWANNWTIDLPGDCGVLSDGDGWEYGKDFKSFTQNGRFFKVGDTCRRRRWTRTRLMKPPKINDPLRPLHIAWRSATTSNGEKLVNITSPLTLYNRTELDLSLLGYSLSWERDYLLGLVGPEKKYSVPVHLSCLTHIRFAIDDKKRTKPGEALSEKSLSCSDHILIIPKSSESQSIFRASIVLDYARATQEHLPRILHFSVKLICKSGCSTITVDPILYVENLLPCPLQYRLFEGCDSGNVNELSLDDRILEEQSLDIGMKNSSMAVDSSLNPHISFRVPGYRWSKQQRIVNRKLALHTWRPGKQDRENHLSLAEDSSENIGGSYTASIRFERLTYGGDPLEIVLEVMPGDRPLLRVFAQYWIIDKTGFGLRFCDGFGDLLGNTLQTTRPRRSYLLHKERQNEAFLEDLSVGGHEWTIGMKGMTLFFSKESKLAVSIDRGDRENPNENLKRINSNWSRLVDISNVMPKAVFSVAEFQGERQFDLSYDVTIAPSVYSKTKIVTIYNRFHLVNLSETPYYVSQQNSGKISTMIPPKSTVPFHWESKALDNKVQLSVDNRQWTPGCVQLDNVGVSALRLPDHNPTTPSVVQIEVRLAKSDLDCAVTVLIWNADDQQNPLYKIVNNSSYTVLCNQSHDKQASSAHVFTPSTCGGVSQDQAEACNPKTTLDLLSNGLNCGLVESDFNEMVEDKHFTWNIKHGESLWFGLDNSQKSHAIEWTCEELQYENISRRPNIDIDAIGLTSEQILPSGKKIGCTVRADQCTKVIEFFDFVYNNEDKQHPVLVDLKDKLVHHRASLSLQEFSPSTKKLHDEDLVAFSFKFIVPGLHFSIIDNSTHDVVGREIFLLSIENASLTVSQTRNSYQELELKILSLQIDNYIKNAVHPVLFACPHFKEEEPFLHISVLRNVNSTVANVYRYVAFRMLTADIALDRRTAETIAKLVRPFERIDLKHQKDIVAFQSLDSTSNVDATQIMASKRLYIEQLHLHPIRISLTFTQDGTTADVESTKSMILQYIRKVPSLSQAELIFTSFVVSHAFESPQVFPRIIGTHYLSQLTNQFFSIIGSLDILNGPADFLTNIGTGVRDFFYEPINGLVHGPDKFIEGLENGSISLARGIFVGFVRGAANVTYVVNANLVHLTDEDFIDERNAYQRSITDSLSRSNKPRTISDSLHIAGVSIARGVKSGAVGLVDEPWQNFTRHGPIGLVKGVGKALVGAIVKPMIGVGDGVVVVMNHVSELTSNETTNERIPKRLRRALKRKVSHKKNSVILVPFDEKAAKAQKIVTANDTKDDAYLCHVNIINHLIIASDNCLWIINRASKDPYCLKWEEISHFGMIDERFMQVTMFSPTGLKPMLFEVDSPSTYSDFFHLLTLQESKMGNSACHVDGSIDVLKLTSNVPGIDKFQAEHTFGVVNSIERPFQHFSIHDEMDVVEKCFARVQHLSGDSQDFFSSLDHESWSLINSWRYLFSGLKSRHCMVAGFINGTDSNIQIKSTILIEGGSPCYHIPSRDYDETFGALSPGAAIMFFAWGMPPSLQHEGNIHMSIETNTFLCNLHNKDISLVSLKPSSNIKGIFLEKSLSDWWAKYWVLISE